MTARRPKPPLMQSFNDIAKGTETLAYSVRAVIKHVGCLRYVIDVLYTVRTETDVLPDPNCQESAVHWGTRSTAQRCAKRMMRRVRAKHLVNPRRPVEWTTTL